MQHVLVGVFILMHTVNVLIRRVVTGASPHKDVSFGDQRWHHCCHFLMIQALRIMGCIIHTNIHMHIYIFGNANLRSQTCEFACLRKGLVTSQCLKFSWQFEHLAFFTPICAFGVRNLKRYILGYVVPIAQNLGFTWDFPQKTHYNLMNPLTTRMNQFWGPSSKFVDWLLIIHLVPRGCNRLLFSF